MGTIVVQWAAAIVDYLAQLGAPREALLRAGGLDASAFAQPGLRVRREQYEALWSYARHEGGGNPRLAFVRDVLDAQHLGVFGYLARAQASVGAALVTSAAFHRLIKDDTETQVVQEDRGAWLSYRRTDGSSAGAADEAEGVLAAHAVLAGRWSATGRGALEVHLRHERPAHASLLDEVFRCRIRYGEAENRVLLARDQVHASLVSRDDALALELEQLAHQRNGSLPPRPLSAELRQAIGQTLERGDAELGRVAAVLGTSARTLQRRLKEAGLSFRDELDAVRRSRALEALRRRERPIGEIALSLGFSDARAFRRAVHRWTGASPRGLASPGLRAPARSSM